MPTGSGVSRHPAEDSRLAVPGLVTPLLQIQTLDASTLSELSESDADKHHQAHPVAATAGLLDDLSLGLQIPDVLHLQPESSMQLDEQLSLDLQIPHLQPESSMQLDAHLSLDLQIPGIMISQPKIPSTDQGPLPTEMHGDSGEGDGDILQAHSPNTTEQAREVKQFSY
jgi:hypothetical protein